MVQKRDIVLVINSVEPGLVAATNKLSQKLGIELKGVVLLNASHADRTDRYTDESGLFEEVTCNFDNPEEVQQTLKPYTDRLLLATCRFESGIESFRQVIPFLPYVYTPSETSLGWSTDKHSMRDRLRGYDENLVPHYKQLTSFEPTMLPELIKDLTFPVIVKPSGLAASLLVTRCEDAEELEICLTKTFKALKKIHDRERFAFKPKLLVEEMMEGDMYSTDAYVNHKGDIVCLPFVKVITAHAIGLPGFYSYRHIVPTGLSEEEISRAKQAASASLKALNLRSTTAHIEMFHTASGWKIIEVGARMGGYREALYREAYGIDHHYNDQINRIGLEPEVNETPLRHAAGMNIYAESEGHIESITGLEEAKQLESVVFLASHVEIGDLALFASNGGNLIIDGILSNEDPEQLERDVAKVRELIQINIRPIEADA